VDGKRFVEFNGVQRIRFRMGVQRGERNGRNAMEMGESLVSFNDHYEVSPLLTSACVVHRDTFYQEADFQEMKKLGLNTIRIPVGCECTFS